MLLCKERVRCSSAADSSGSDHSNRRAVAGVAASIILLFPNLQVVLSWHMESPSIAGDCRNFLMVVVVNGRLLQMICII